MSMHSGGSTIQCKVLLLLTVPDEYVSSQAWLYNEAGFDIQ